MVTGIIPIWVTYYALDILKMENAKVLNSHDEKYHVYDHEFGSYIRDEKQRRRRGIFYAIIVGFVFLSSHYVAANYSEEPAGFYPPYVEKKVVYPELYKNQSGHDQDKNK